MKRNLTIFIGITALCITGCFLIFSCGSRGISIVKNGKPKAVISVPGDASKQVIDAANLLSEYIEKSTGAKLTVETDISDEKNVTIHVGEDDYAKNLNLDLESIDIDGFLITFPDRKNIVIAGHSDWGTEFGVYEFLERFVGVRWLEAAFHQVADTHSHVSLDGFGGHGPAAELPTQLVDRGGKVREGVNQGAVEVEDQGFHVPEMGCERLHASSPR